MTAVVRQVLKLRLCAPPGLPRWIVAEREPKTEVCSSELFYTAKSLRAGAVARAKLCENSSAAAASYSEPRMLFGAFFGEEA